MLRKILIAAMLWTASCSSTGGENGRLKILVSIAPQEYFAARIAGDRADVTVLIPPGANPASFELSPSDMRLISDADVWFSAGVLSERGWEEDFPGINSELLIVDTVKSIERLPVDRYSIPGEAVSSEQHQSHSGETDPHVWLSPELVKSQASAMAETLKQIDPGNSEYYTENLELFIEDISDLQQELHSILDPHAGSSFIVFHPAWGYFADEFDIVMVPIEIAGSEPSPGEMSSIVDHAGEMDIQIVFVSPQFSTSSAEAVAEELGAEVMIIDPLSARWLDNIRSVAEQLQGALR